jgi:hypothetical protein
MKRSPVPANPQCAMIPPLPARTILAGLAMYLR